MEVTVSDTRIEAANQPGKAAALTGSQDRDDPARSVIDALVIDDEEHVAALLCAMIGALGLRVHATRDPEAFLHLARVSRPSWLVVDLFMPGVDGLEIIRRLSASCAARVVLTSGGGERLLETAMQLAGDSGLRTAGVLPKPFRQADVRRLFGPPVRFARPVASPPDPPSEAAELRLDTLEAALAADAFVAHFQPKFDATGQHLAGFEALARWQRTGRPPIGPAAFMSAITQCGLHGPLFETMLDQACALAAALPEAVRSVALNLDPVLVGDAMIDRAIDRACSRHGVAPSCLVLEITEAGGADLALDQIGHLLRLRMRGIKLSIDDFGTGQSTVSRLFRVPFDELKIDRTLIRMARTAREGRSIIRALTRLAHSLGMAVTAEGVEDDQTHRFVAGLGCDRVQGYLFGRPMPADRALACANRPVAARPSAEVRPA